MVSSVSPTAAERPMLKLSLLSTPREMRPAPIQFPSKRTGAPVPVVSVKRESWRLGGAANVANNIRSLGGEPRLVSVVGEDEAGRSLRRELEREGTAPKAQTKTMSTP